MAESPFVTLTLDTYAGAGRVWAFANMGLARRDLARVPGLRFWRLVGSGHGAGFTLRPNWSRYGLLAVWDARVDAERFLDGSSYAAATRAQASRRGPLECGLSARTARGRAGIRSSHALASSSRDRWPC